MKRLMIALIRFYQKHISGLKKHPTCRFYPTCSSYAIEAFEKRGFFAGFALMAWRIMRCSPMSPCGFDPVPKKGFKTMPARFSKYDKEKYDKELSERLKAEEESAPQKTDGQKDAPKAPEACNGHDTETGGCDQM